MTIVAELMAHAKDISFKDRWGGAHRLGVRW